MNLPAVFETCEPGEDVLNGTNADADFAADLAKVIRGTASDDDRIPTRLFANTCPTGGLKSLLRNVLARLAGDFSAAACVFRLDISDGGDKTHGLIVLTHAGCGLKGVSNVAEGIEQMGREGAYWPGIAMRRKNPRHVLSTLRILLAVPRPRPISAPQR